MTREMIFPLILFGGLAYVGGVFVIRLLPIRDASLSDKLKTLLRRRNGFIFRAACCVYFSMLSIACIAVVETKPSHGFVLLGLSLVFVGINALSAKNRQNEINKLKKQK